MRVGKNSKHSKKVDEHGRFFSSAVVFRSILMLLLWSMLTSVWAGGSCVVAKRQGDSLAIEWQASFSDSALSAMEKAKKRLLDQGYRKKGQDVHAQAGSDLPHAYLVIVKTGYTTLRGQPRTSYGCGFSPVSAGEAERAALYDLRNYSWGWKPEFGYEVVERFRY
ncbi:MAG: hypothetical protein JAY71_03015 [Candidatus Thiodiazotropha weberae]|nr:hypothetical protein [Candidatus Thiodiazotropha weberae]